MIDIQTYSTFVVNAFFVLSAFILAGSAAISFYEKEWLAGKRLMAALLLSMPLAFVSGYFNYQAKPIVAIGLMAIVFAAGYLLLKKPVTTIQKPPLPARDMDEMDTIFARMKLEPGSFYWDSYYKSRPYQAEQDAKARSLPGLLAENSIYFNPITYSVSEANFQVIHYLQKAINQHAIPVFGQIGPGRLTRFLKDWAAFLGTHSIGVTELKDYHLYTSKGRGENIGKPVTNSHKYAIAFTVEMDFRNMQAAPASSTIFESSQQYLNSATIALQLANFLKNQGFDTRAHIDGDYEVICPLVARDAGLGEIGRMGLLMTPRLGPRVRIAVVTTDAPLVADQYHADPTMIDFCRFCKKCAECCPGKSIMMDDMKLIKGVLRWQVNSESCYQYWCTAGTDCGRCISVCPFSHPNNILHHTIRRLIRRSSMVARLAYMADDWLYGRKPKPKELPKWMKMD
jgi:reductive dehalogenase